MYQNSYENILMRDMRVNHFCLDLLEAYRKFIIFKDAFFDYTAIWTILNGITALERHL